MKHITDAHEWDIPFLGPVPLGGILTLHTLMMLIGTGLVLFLFLVLYRKEDRVPVGITNCLEMLVVFIRDEIAIPNLGPKDGLLFTPMLCTLGFFILTLNLLGLIPLFASATGNISITFPLAYLIFILLTVGTLYRGGVKGFWNGLMPPGLPVFVVPLFSMIELTMLCVRSLILAIRLFANMIAGHMVVLTFLGLLILIGWFTFPLVIPAAILMYGMDIFIAFLQAYIFILLSAVFLGQMYHPQH